MKKYIMDLRLNGLTKSDTLKDSHAASLVGFVRNGATTCHIVTIDGLSPEMAKVLGATYAQTGVRITIEVCEPGEEL